MSLKIKSGVNIESPKPQLWFALGAAFMAFEAIARKDLVVTSLNDGTHGEKSKHYEGLAADFRIRHLTAEQASHLVAVLRSILDPLGFDTILESDHIHCEYDPKAGERLWATE